MNSGPSGQAIRLMTSPEKIDRAIDTTPVWGTIVHALKNLERGGRLVINAIRKEEADKKELLGLLIRSIYGWKRR